MTVIDHEHLECHNCGMLWKEVHLLQIRWDEEQVRLYARRCPRCNHVGKETPKR